MPRFVDYPPMGLGGYLNTTGNGTTFMAECRGCGERREVLRETLEAAGMAHAALSDIAKRLRCDSCGTRDADLLTGYYVE